MLLILQLDWLLQLLHVSQGRKEQGTCWSVQAVNFFKFYLFLLFHVCSFVLDCGGGGRIHKGVEIFPDFYKGEW